MKNKDNINMYQLHLEILLQAEENEYGTVRVFGYIYKDGNGKIKFACENETYTMYFEKGLLVEIKKGIEI